MSADDKPGIVDGRYAIRQLLDSSGLRNGYRAFDSEVEVEVGLWLLPLALWSSDKERSSFVSYCKELRGLRSQRLMRLFDAGEATHEGKKVVYLTWQLGTASAWSSMVSAADGLTRARDHLSSLVAALDEAHALTVGDEALVHGCLVPGDLVEVAGQRKLAGVGLWQAIDSVALQRADAEACRYLAPELRNGGTATPGSDWFSVAAMIADLACSDHNLPLEDCIALLQKREPGLHEILRPYLSSNSTQRPIGGKKLLDAVAPFLGLGKAPGEEAGATLVDGDMAVPPTQNSDTVIELRNPVNLPARTESTAETTEYQPRRGSPVPAREQRPVGKPMRTREQASQVGGRWIVLATLVALIGAVALGWSYWKTGMKRQDREAPEVQRVEKTTTTEGIVAGQAAQPSTIAPQPPPVITAEGQSNDLADPSDSNSARKDCPASMVLVPKRQVCIDTHEFPGFGQTPTLASLKSAREQCAEEGKYLCPGKIWERACRKGGKGSWPYGDRFRPGICNLQSSELREAGSMAECHSPADVFDMSGNAAEWDAEGRIRGGSAFDRSQGRCAQALPGRKARQKNSAVGFRCCADRVAKSGGSD